ncbi:MAG: OmpA family protein [Gemmatimonadales bacterium]
MTTEADSPETVERNGQPEPAAFDRLRDLLVGPERERLEDAERELEAARLTPERLAEHLPEAVAIRGRQDRRLARALTPTVERALRESVRRNPRELAAAIFPVLGPAIRKAVAETMAGLVRTINTAIQHSFSVRGLKWRWEAWRSGVPYAKVLIRHALVYRVEQIYLIHAETGLLLAHVAQPDLTTPNADLVSGMLTAIQDFVSDSFGPQGSGGRLRTFSVGELTVMVEPGPHAVLAAVVRGQAPEGLLETLQATVESIHLDFGDALVEFEGDTAPFASAGDRLAECLETVLTTDRDDPSKRVWLVWAVPLVLLLVGWGWLRVRANQRWDAAVAAIDASPGLVVVEAARGFRRASLRGLRDPLAASPKALAAGFGLDTVALDDRWEPYQSLEPAMIVARARAALRAPESVSLELRGVDSLLVTGRAPVEWLWAARATPLPAGINRVDYSALVPVLPAEAETHRRELESSRVLFGVGSADLDPAARAAVRTIATTMRGLQSALAPTGTRAVLELTGRTDPTGRDDANQALSQWRVDGVRGALIAAGIEAELLSGRGIGSSSPIAAPAAADRERVNRSVSLTIVLEPVASKGTP